MAKDEGLFETVQDGIKIFEPAGKSYEDQYQMAMDEIQALGRAPVIQMKQVDEVRYANDSGFEYTGSGAVDQSTGPYIIRDDLPSQKTLLLMGAALFFTVYKFLGGSK